MNRALIQWIRSTTKRHRAPEWTPQAVRNLARGLSQYVYRRYHLRSLKQALSGRIANLADAEAYLRKNAVPVQAPLVIISQVQRSGGTLLSQLFDGHPDLCAYPHELKFDFPTSDSWPQLDTIRGMKWNFIKLFDLNFPQQVSRGFTKGDRNPKRHSFMLMSRVQYHLFGHLFETQKPTSARGILDQFFTAFFNAWLNYQGDLKRKRWITAFAPRLAHHNVNMDRFFADYPDGRLIQILRDPKGWYPSAKNHVQSGFGKKGPEHILNRWRVSAESMLHNRGRFGDKVIIVRFEDIVGRTEATMRALAEVLGIEWDPILLVPTFNGEPMYANSSFSVETSGVIQAPLERAAMLSTEERDLIEGQYAELHRQIVEQALVVETPNPLRAAAGH
jgi:Sulfotransferase family